MHTKTRSDYHDLQDAHVYPVFHFARWLKPLLLIGLGFVLGLMYHKQVPDDANKAILMSAQTKTSTMPAVTQKNQARKGGAVISSRA